MSARCARCGLEYPTTGQLTAAGECPYPPSNVLECRDRELALLRQKLAARPTRDDFYHWWSALTNDERHDCWYDLDAMAHPEVVASLKEKLAASERENEPMRLVWEWTKGHKYRSITGPHWNYSDFEMWVRFEQTDGSAEPEFVVNAADPVACYSRAAEKLGLIDKAGG